MNAVAEHQKAQSNRLTRSPHGMIAGVCAGLSECFGINLIFARFVFIVLALANGIGVLVYLILILIIPARSRADAQATELVSPPPRSRKTVFAYIAGAISVCAALLSFLVNLSSIVENIRHLTAIVTDDRALAAVDRPDARSVTPTTSAASPIDFQAINAVQGAARVSWRAGGLTHDGEIRMAGSLGSAWVVFRDPSTSGIVQVQQDLSLVNNGQNLFLVGSNPTPSSYFPDTFSLVMDDEGYFQIVESCDINACNAVDGSSGRFQIMFR